MHVPTFSAKSRSLSVGLLQIANPDSSISSLTWSVGPRVAGPDSQHVCRNFVSKETRTLFAMYEEAWVHSLPASEAIPLAYQTLRCSGNIAEVWLVPARACS